MRKFEFYCRVISSIIFIFFLINSSNATNDNSNGVYLGFVFADSVTWILATIFEVPKLTMYGLIELVFIVLVIGIINSFSPLSRPNGSEAEAIAFLVFMGVVSIKIGWYFLKMIDDDLKST